MSTNSAIKALTQDIVWYENQTVELNGKQYTALMPRLYLAGATLEDLSKTPQAFLSALMFVPFVMVCSLAILVIVFALSLRLLTAVISPDWLRRVFFKRTKHHHQQQWHNRQ
jgi:hypothetical protein